MLNFPFNGHNEAEIKEWTKCQMYCFGYNGTTYKIGCYYKMCLLKPLWALQQEFAIPSMPMLKEALKRNTLHENNWSSS